jgi:5-methylcytosine-specific restriction protein A
VYVCLSPLPRPVRGFLFVNIAIRICQSEGCSRLTTHGLCDEHRGDMSALHSTARWQKMRAQQLALHPLCASCALQGRVVAATVADHVTPHHNVPRLFWEGDLQSLCRDCHEGFKKRLEVSGVENGCDHNGVPIGAAHHWKEKTVPRGGGS